VRYSIFNLTIESWIPLPELPPSASRAQPTVIIREPSCHPPDHSIAVWIRRWYRDAEQTEIQMTVGRIDTQIVLSFPPRADFVIGHDLSSVDCFPGRDTSGPVLRHLLVDQVIPRVLGQRGNLVLHASAIEMPTGQGAVFVGNSGWGKSTLASSFFRNGARLVTDDCLLLEAKDGRLVGVPSYCGSRLWTDSALALFPHHVESVAVSETSDKKRLILHDDSIGVDVPIHGVFVLTNPEKDSHAAEVRVTRISGAENLMALLRCGFMVDPHDVHATARQFSSACRIAATSPSVYSISYPRDFGRLTDVHAAIEGVLASTIN
jgi:hypothetical protein